MRVHCAAPLVAVALVAACTSDPPARRAAPSTPTAGGTLVFGVVGDPPTIKPSARVASDLTHWLRSPVGPYRIERFVPGFEVAYTASGTPQEEPLLDRLVVRFVQSLDIALALLERGELDAASLPASVNLLERLHEHDLNAAAELGTELVYLDLRGSDFDTPSKTALAALADVPSLEEAFVKDLGRPAQTLHPKTTRSGARGPFTGLGVAEVAAGGRLIQLAAPVGDELLGLIQRALHDDWERHGFEVDVVTINAKTFYGDWAVDPHVDVALRRADSVGLPSDGPAFRSMDLVPLFQVASVVAWRDGVHGIRPNTGTLGPLVEADRWWKEDGG